MNHCIKKKLDDNFGKCLNELNRSVNSLNAKKKIFFKGQFNMRQFIC